MVSIVVAFAGNGVIGRDGGLPWHLPTDMKRFRELTIERVVIMGRRTFESLPDRFRPLPDRRNLVLSSRRDWQAPGAEVFPDLASALEACAGDCFVIGGEQTYREALSLAERVYATEVEGEIDGEPIAVYVEPADPAGDAGSFAADGYFAEVGFSLSGVATPGEAVLNGAVAGRPVELAVESGEGPDRVRTLKGTYEGPAPLLLLLAGALLFFG